MAEPEYPTLEMVTAELGQQFRMMGVPADQADELGRDVMGAVMAQAQASGRPPGATKLPEDVIEAILRKHIPGYDDIPDDFNDLSGLPEYGDGGVRSVAEKADEVARVHAEAGWVPGRKLKASALEGDARKDSTWGERGAEALREWYEGGAAGAINWGEPGDFDACVEIAGQYIDNPEGYCNLRHQGATGAPPGHAPGEEEDKAKALRYAVRRWRRRGRAAIKAEIERKQPGHDASVFLRALDRAAPDGPDLYRTVNPPETVKMGMADLRVGDTVDLAPANWEAEPVPGSVRLHVEAGAKSLKAGTEIVSGGRFEVTSPVHLDEAGQLFIELRQVGTFVPDESPPS
jgi:hypothetical protein